MHNNRASRVRQNALFAVLCAACCALILAAYANHFHNPFQFDDQNTIVANAYEHDTRDLPRFFTDITTSNVLPANQDYRPVLSAFYALNYAWGSGGSFVFHVSQFSCFLALCFALFFVACKIFDAAQPSPRNKFLALGAAAFYGLHTANAETINYIHAASDSLSALMIVVSLVLFQYAPAYRKYGFYLIPVALGMLIKITTAVYPIILFLYILLFETKDMELDFFSAANRRKLFHALMQSIPSLAVCLGLLGLWKLMLPATFAPSIYARLDYALAQPFVLVHYLDSFFLPLNLSADSDWQPVTHVWDDRVLAGTVILISLLVLAWRSALQPKTRPIAFGILWFFAASLPTSSGIIPMGEVMNDHRMFLPFIGLTIGLWWGLGLFLFGEKKTAGRETAKALVVIALPVIFLAHAYGVYERNKVWQNDESLWYDVTLKSPENSRGLMNYGTTQMAKGDYERAQHYYEQALIYAPYYGYLYINLGIVTDAMGHAPEAEGYFKKALVYGGNYPDGYYYYAAFLDTHGRDDEAIPLLTTAIHMSPASLDYRFLLMRIYASRSSWKTLAEQVRAVQDLAPADPRLGPYIQLIDKND